MRASRPPRVLLLDNHDSFTWNLVQAFAVLGADVEVVVSDRWEPPFRYEGWDALVVSPGPGRPEHAGHSVAAIRGAPADMPVLGVCLGHQAIAQAFGAAIVGAAELRHGKTSPIRHDGRGVFEGLPDPFEATRYHSLAVDGATLPRDLTACAEAPDGTIMGLRHRALPVHGVQFHPESILTPQGSRLLANFLAMTAAEAASR